MADLSWSARITHAGMACSLGLDSLNACAAARAGLVRVAPLRTLNPDADELLSGQHVVGHALPCGVGDGYTGLAKAVALARPAWADLERQQPFGNRPRGRIALFLVVSDRYWTRQAARLAREAGDAVAALGEDLAIAWQLDALRLPDMLLSHTTSLRFDDVRVALGGHSTISFALRAASAALASGSVAHAVVGAIDCFIEPTELRAAAALDELKTESRPVGFMPGEAAVFLAVGPGDRSPTWQLGSDAALQVLGHGEAHASLPDAEVAGRALAEAIRLCLASAPPELREASWDIASDLNGSARRADEWGHCIVRLQAAGAWRGRRQSCIAEAIGEVGCASGGASLALAFHAARRGCLATRPLLMPLSSDGGHKAALLVAP